MQYLYIGPSLPDVRDHVDTAAVRILPPVAAGDLLRLPLGPGVVIGIVDGYFHQQGAVRHKEIFAALASGATVLGASSMGALRAAELDRWGMVGVGAVYAAYRDRRVVADDEVALLHGPAEAGYPAFSQPLVNIRATLTAAVAAGLLTADAAAGIVARLARVHYPRRSYRLVATLAGELGVADPDALAAFCRDHAVDLKRDDALALLARMRAGVEPGPAPELSRTAMLLNWQLAARGRTDEDGVRVSEASLLRACQLFADDYPALHRRLVFDKVVEECRSRCPGGRPDAPVEDVVLAHGAHRGFYPERAERDLAFVRGWTSTREQAESTDDELLLRFITRTFRIWPRVMPREAALERLRDLGALDRAERIVRAAIHLERRVRAAGKDSSLLPRRRIIETFARRWAIPAAEVEFAALDRGFESLEAFVEAARPYYLLAKYEPATTELTVHPGHAPASA